MNFISLYSTAAKVMTAAALLLPMAAQAFVVSGTYVGNGTSQTITLGFQPDVVIVKDSQSSGSPPALAMQIRTSTMTETKDMGASAVTQSVGSDRITALTSTGFTVGAGANANGSGKTFHYLAFNAVANEIAVGTYTGNGVDNRNITGLSFQPDMVLTTAAEAGNSVWRTAEMPSGSSLNWTEITQTDGVKNLLATGFQVGTGSAVNANGVTHHYIACKKATGKFVTGTYNGSSVARSITGLGFTPEALFIRIMKGVVSTPATAIKFKSSGTGDVAFTTTASNSFTGAITALDADGFSLGTATRVNWLEGGTAHPYYYFAFNGAAPSSITAPTVTTATQSGVTHNSATLGGNVTADGGDTVSERGIVWGTSANPTTSNSKVQIGSGTGAFSQLVTGLPASTTVHVRAYAINTAGTAYGDNISFTTSATPVAVSSLVRANANPSNAGTVNWTLTFASAVTGVTASNLSLSGAAATGASVGTPSTGNGGISWNVPVSTGGTDGTLTLNLANSTGITPGVSTALPYAGESYTMDKTPPQVLSVNRLTPAGQQTASTTVVFRVTYSEPVVLNAPAASRFAVVPVGGADVVGSISSVTPVSPEIYDIGVNITGGTGEFRLRVRD